MILIIIKERERMSKQVSNLVFYAQTDNQYGYIRAKGKKRWGGGGGGGRGG